MESTSLSFLPGLPVLYLALCVPIGFLLWDDGRVGYGYQDAYVLFSRFCIITLLGIIILAGAGCDMTPTSYGLSLAPSLLSYW